jgi:2-polyprenyl-3-methyl-5-hydroxy-6-metoxy-1,4-benzoquinol methylase
MEITKQVPAWLDETHPNFIRWERARSLSIERGKFVKQILSQFTSLKNLWILDLGSGEGGTSKIFDDENIVISADLSLLRLHRQRINLKTKNSVNCNAMILPFKNSCYDVVILQDVFEHIIDKKILITAIKKVLKPDGILYLSTPNKFFLLNILSDPHWGMPLVSLLKRETIRNYFLKYFRKSEIDRTDLAELSSLKEIYRLFSDEFEINLHTKFAVKNLFGQNNGIIWSDFHLSLIRFLKTLSIEQLIIKFANDDNGIINKFFTPTFYFVMKRKI